MPINPNAVFGTHHLSPHHLWHTIFHTPFCHTPSFTQNCFLSRTTFTQTIFHTQLCHIHHFLCRTPFLTHNIVTYTHTIFLRQIQSFTYHFVTHNSSHPTCFTSRSSTTAFVFPSFPVPARTFVAHYWKNLTCGVIRSFN